MPLSPYLFPLALRGPLKELKRRVDTLEGGGLVVAHQDDIYIFTRPGHFATVMGWAEELLAEIGLQLNATKTYWAHPMQPNDAAVEAKGAKRDFDIKVLKQSLPTRLTGLQQSDASTEEKARERRKNLCARVLELAEAGLGGP